MLVELFGLMCPSFIFGKGWHGQPSPSASNRRIGALCRSSSNHPRGADPSTSENLERRPHRPSTVRTYRNIRRTGRLRAREMAVQNSFQPLPIRHLLDALDHLRDDFGSWLVENTIRHPIMHYARTPAPTFRRGLAVEPLHPEQFGLHFVTRARAFRAISLAYGSELWRSIARSAFTKAAHETALLSALSVSASNASDIFMLDPSLQICHAAKPTEFGACRRSDHEG